MSEATASLDALPRTSAHPHQQYRLDIPQARSSAQAEVFSFHGERAIGEPARYVIRFTHPRHDLPRDEYLNRPATFIIQPPIGPPTISSITPESAPSNSAPFTLTVSGSNFTDDPVVYSTSQPILVQLPGGRLKYVNPYIITLPKAPAEMVNTINGYIKASQAVGTP